MLALSLKCFTDFTVATYESVLKNLTASPYTRKILLFKSANFEGLFDNDPH